MDKRRLLKQMAKAAMPRYMLAKQIGMGKNTITSRLDGKTEFTTGEITRICKVLKITEPSEICKIFLPEAIEEKGARA